MKACSRPAVHQVIYQIALYSKIAAAITLLFRTASSKWFIAVWIIMCLGIVLLGLLFLTQVVAAVRVMARKYLTPKIIAIMLTVLVVLGLANAVLIGMNAFSKEDCTEATKASLVYDVLSTVLVIVLILLTVFWPVDILSDSQNMVDAELGSAGNGVSTAGQRNKIIPVGEDGGLSNMSNSASVRNNSSM